jgi:hypothetical protein
MNNVCQLGFDRVNQCFSEELAVRQSPSNTGYCFQLGKDLGEIVPLKMLPPSPATTRHAYSPQRTIYL